MLYFNRSHSYRTLALTSLCSVALLTSLGCATRGYQKAAATSDAVTMAANQVEMARTQITETSSALRDLAGKPVAQLRPAFERYRSAVGALQLTAAELKRQTDEMEKQGRTYFDAWDQGLSQIRSEDIRARSAERQREVTAQFNDIQRRYQDARREFDGLVSTLVDIRSSLGVDLTPAGIEGARQFMTQADSTATQARTALDRLAEGLRTLSSTLNPTGAPRTTST